MEVKDLIRLPDPRKNVRIEMREVVRNVFDKPHILIRVRLTGWHFPGRALEPFLLIGKVVSRTVIIDNDGLGANAYFDKLFPATKRVSFGYGNVILWYFDLSIDPKNITRLERARLPEGAIDPFRPGKRLSEGHLLPNKSLQRRRQKRIRR
jgi:hypothetical protein